MTMEGKYFKWAQEIDAGIIAQLKTLMKEDSRTASKSDNSRINVGGERGECLRCINGNVSLAM